RFEIGADQHFREQSHENARYASHDCHHGNQRQRRGNHGYVVDDLQHDHSGETYNPKKKGQNPEPSKKVNRLHHISIEKLHHDQVKNDFDDTFQAVVRVAMPAPVVAHWHIDHLSAHPACIDRDKAMHLAIETHIFDDVGPIGF